MPIEANERGYAVVGLGYVGLPVALALAKRFQPVYGFDISQNRIAELRDGKDRTREVSISELRTTKLQLTDSTEALAAASFFIVTVPTPIDAGRRPNLDPIVSACQIIGKVLRPGSVVVFEFDGLSGPYPRDVRPFAGAGIGLAGGRGFQARLFA